MMRRAPAGLVAIVVAVGSSAAACGRDGDAAADRTVTVGVTIEKTGPYATLGNALPGIEAAAAYLNGNGGIDGKAVELVVRDNAGDPSRAINHVKEFARDGIDVVVGPVSGPVCFATAAVFESADLVDFCISGDVLPEQDGSMFGVGTDFMATTEADFDLMEQLGDKVGTFAPTNQSGDDKAQLAEEEAKERGIDIDVERHDTNATSLRPQIQKLLADGVDTLHLTSCAPITITAAKEAIDLGFDGKILIENCHVSTATAEAVKGFANDQVIVLAPQFMLGPPAPDDPRAGAIVRYERHVGEPDIVVAAGWDALMMAAQAIDETGSSDPEKLVSTLEDGFTYTGVWSWNEIEGDEHRGARPDGALIPAYITAQGTFEKLPAGP